jgi:hypothetical protein
MMTRILGGFWAGGVCARTGAIDAEIAPIVAASVTAHAFGHLRLLVLILLYSPFLTQSDETLGS